jgi:hypothetical protein
MSIYCLFQFLNLKIRIFFIKPFAFARAEEKLVTPRAKPSAETPEEKTWLIRDEKYVEVEGMVEEPEETPKLAEGVVTEQRF